MSNSSSSSSRIAFIVTPAGQRGGGMGRIKDYILQSGGDRLGRVVFAALDSRGDGPVVLSLGKIFLVLVRLTQARLKGNLAFVHVNVAEKGSLVRKGIVVAFCRLIGVPVVLHLHAAKVLGHYHKAGRSLRWLISLPFRLATCCVVIGHLWRDWLVNEVGIDPAKVAVVYNGVPVEPILRPHNEGKKRILFLGNLTERKGVTDLLQAFNLLADKALAWEATMAGGGDVDYYRSLAAELGLTQRVRFMGWVDQGRVLQLLRTHDIMVLPSYDEGLPLAILEALGSGTAVVSTPVGSIPEVTEDGKNILFVKAGDSKDIAAKIRMLLQDASLREKIAEGGSKLYLQRFTLETFIENLFAVYRRHCGVVIER